VVAITSVHAAVALAVAGAEAATPGWRFRVVVWAGLTWLEMKRKQRPATERRPQRSAESQSCGSVSRPRPMMPTMNTLAKMMAMLNSTTLTAWRTSAALPELGSGVRQGPDAAASERRSLVYCLGRYNPRPITTRTMTKPRRTMCRISAAVSGRKLVTSSRRSSGL
jgi:hypothetical protein